MPKRQRGSKKAKKPVQILSEALDFVVSPAPAESHFAAAKTTAKSTAAKPATSKVKKTKYQKYQSSSIKTYSELVAAIEAGEPHVVLADNIIVQDNLLIKQNLIIDFNGFSIIAEDNLPSARILDIRSGEVTLAGKGKVFAMGPNGVALRAYGAISSGLPEYTVVHVGPDIQLFAPNAYGILISPNLGVAYGLTINFAGRIFARDGICIASGVNGHDLHLPSINIKPNSSIVADEASGAAIEAIGYGVWNISEARLSGAVGANLKSGQLELSNSQVIANAGPAFNLIENSSKDLEVTLAQGSYVSMLDDVIMGSPASVKKFLIKSAQFYGLHNIIAPELKGTINPKKSPLHSDISSFLETLLPQMDLKSESSPESTPAETTAEANPGSPHPDSLSVAPEAEPALHELSTSADELSKADTAQALATDDATDTVSEYSSTEASLDQELILAEFAKSEPSTDDFSVDESILDAFAEDSISEEFSLSSALEQTSSELASASSLSTSVSNAQYSSSQTEPTNEPANLPAQPISAPASALSASLKISHPRKSPAIITNPTPIGAVGAASSTVSPTPVTRPQPSTLPAFRAPARPGLLSEQEAAQNALADAIVEIRKLKPEDYEAGFADLERALRKAEHILASPLADLADVRDASSMLLQAFDSLEERDEFSLSDEELDELFYHGAVLEEVAHPEKPSKSSHPAKSPKSSKSAPIVLPPLASASAESTPEPDFSVLSEIITTIAGLRLENYTPESQESLLDELDRAELILANMSSSQSEIDEIATSLLAEMSKLERTHFSHSTAANHAKVNAPAPVIGAVLPTTMIDELAPATTWMLGTTMIDELTPCLMDVSTRQQVLRAMQPWIHEIVDMATEPFKKLSRSLAAGIRAGRHAYRESLRSSTHF